MAPIVWPAPSTLPRRRQRGGILDEALDLLGRLRRALRRLRTGRPRPRNAALLAGARGYRRPFNARMLVWKAMSITR